MIEEKPQVLVTGNKDAANGIRYRKLALKIANKSLAFGIVAGIILGILAFLGFGLGLGFVVAFRIML